MERSYCYHPDVDTFPISAHRNLEIFNDLPVLTICSYIEGVFPPGASTSFSEHPQSISLEPLLWLGCNKHLALLRSFSVNAETPFTNGLLKMMERNRVLALAAALNIRIDIPSKKMSLGA